MNEPDVLKIRYSKIMGGLFLVIGLLSFVGMLFTIASKGSVEASQNPSITWIMAPVLIALGVMFLCLNLVKISPTEVKNGGLAGRSIPINGYADLVLDGSKLRRRSDGKIVARLGSLINRQDVAELKRRIGAAQAPQQGYRGQPYQP